VPEKWRAGFSHQEKDKDTVNLLFFRDESLTSEQLDEIRECKRLLKLDPDEREFNLVFGPTAVSKQEIAVQTRSLKISGHAYLHIAPKREQCVSHHSVLE
jgi:hypothetical protein